MTSEQRAYRNLFLLVLGSLGGLVLVGQVFLWFHPPNEIDRRCLKETAATVGQCMWKAMHENQTNK